MDNFLAICLASAFIIFLLTIIAFFICACRLNGELSHKEEQTYFSNVRKSVTPTYSAKTAAELKRQRRRERNIRIAAAGGIEVLNGGR